MKLKMQFFSSLVQIRYQVLSKSQRWRQQVCDVCMELSDSKKLILLADSGVNTLVLCFV